MTDAAHERTNGFTTKEMLIRLETIVDRIERKLDMKAERSDFDAFQVRQVATQAATDLRLLALERTSDSATAVNNYRKWLIGAVFTAAAAATGLVALFLTSH